MTVLESILQSLRHAAAYNRQELAAPRLILWPDEERLWIECLEALRAHYAALWTLGEYRLEEATGPAVWLRYRLDTYQGPEIPILYLPGIGRPAFRSAEQCPPAVRHLYALQFQGQFWTQRNGKDWTPPAYLSTADGGLDLDVASDQATRQAIEECLPKILEAEWESLQGRRLEAGDFRALVTQDPTRTLLKWMSDPPRVSAEMKKNHTEWCSFHAVCRDTYTFDPEKDGALTAAEKMSKAKGAWPLVWQRYKEAPRTYPGVRDLLSAVKPGNLFERIQEYYPQANQEQERRLEDDLLSLASASPKEAGAKIKRLAEEHAHRASWVWATLDESPLARAIEPLHDLVETVETSGNPSGWNALADYYSSQGWKADRCVWQSLYAARTSTSAGSAVTAALRAVYLPWLERLAVLAQATAKDYPTVHPQNLPRLPVEKGTIYLFADGLRLDLARALEERLLAAGLSVGLDCTWAPLPTVTATCKPAWMPLAEKLAGPLEGAGFEPREKEKDKTLTTPRFRQLISDLGMVFLEGTHVGSPQGCAWTECGSIDGYGHSQGARSAWRVEEELAGWQRRIAELLQVGWSKVKVITDHGWLLLPGGLPKAVLPKHLTESRWGRCAVPGPGAQHRFTATSWFWDSTEAVVLAPDICCFQSGMEYAHGGLTLQEALIPSLTVTVDRKNGKAGISLKEMKWSGLRLNVILEGAEGLTVDLRSKAADAAGSFIEKPAAGTAKGGKASMLVTDEDALGKAAQLVILDKTGQPVFKRAVIIGENE